VIGSPLVTQPDIFIAMNGPSFEKFIGSVKPGGKVICDSSLISAKCGRDDLAVYPIPATQLSIDENLEGIANMILLGKTFKETGFVNLQIVQAAISKCVPPRKAHLMEHNLRAIQLGMGL